MDYCYKKERDIWIGGPDGNFEYLYQLNAIKYEILMNEQRMAWKESIYH